MPTSNTYTSSDTCRLSVTAAFLAELSEYASRSDVQTALGEGVV